MKIVDFIREESILPEIRAAKKQDVIRELADHLAEHNEGVNQEDVVRVLLERERLGSTAISEDIAVPHGKLDAVGKLVASFARSRKGIHFGAEDGRPTHFFFVLVAPTRSAGDHLKALARISRLFRNPDFRSRLMAADTAADIYRIIKEEDTAGSR